MCGVGQAQCKVKLKGPVEKLYHCREGQSKSPLPRYARCTSSHAALLPQSSLSFSFRRWALRIVAPSCILSVRRGGCDQVRRVLLQGHICSQTPTCTWASREGFSFAPGWRLERSRFECLEHA